VLLEKKALFLHLKNTLKEKTEYADFGTLSPYYSSA
jgi:hypothetical protein